ncbi:hypothetical protein [Gemmatimonas aurantiaca]|uniref:hypothetical protein n=1 Tax=Gemmatimonas aurantiaca TaxID=173480 RepID=UPI00301DD776
MADRKSFLLRVDRDVLDAVQRWANDDLRSLNGQIEFLLRRALRDAGRAPSPKAGRQNDAAPDSHDASHDVRDDAARTVDDIDGSSSDE